MRYTDGKNQKGELLPPPCKGDLALDRKTGDSYSWNGSDWFLVKKHFDKKPDSFSFHVDALIN